MDSLRGTPRERVEAPVTTGRSYSFDNDFAPLVDVPLHPGMTQRECIDVLARLVRIEATLHQLAAAASDIGLSASWLRLEVVDDGIDDVIEKVTDAIRKRGQHG